MRSVCVRSEDPQCKAGVDNRGLDRDRDTLQPVQRVDDCDELANQPSLQAELDGSDGFVGPGDHGNLGVQVDSQPVAGDGDK